MASDVEAVVRTYYRVVGDLTSTERELDDLLHPDVRFVEHPNALAPHGAARGRAESLAGFAAGKALLAEQTFEIEELIADGERAAVRATWTGTIGADNPLLPVGTLLVAHVAAFCVVRAGRILRHETFDCFEPF